MKIPAEVAVVVSDSYHLVDECRRDKLIVLEARPWKLIDPEGADWYEKDRERARGYAAAQRDRLDELADEDKALMPKAVSLDWSRKIVIFSWQRHIVTETGDRSGPAWSAPVGSWSRPYGMRVELGDDTVTGVNRAYSFLRRTESRIESRNRREDDSLAFGQIHNGMTLSAAIDALKVARVPLYRRMWSRVESGADLALPSVALQEPAQILAEGAL